MTAGPYGSSALNSRAQWCAVAQASMPIRHGGSARKQSSTCARRSFQLSDRPALHVGGMRTWKTCLAIPRPTILICMGRLLFELDCHDRQDATLMPGAEAVHPINGRMRDELLNETLFFDLDDARAKIAVWIADYNDQRPHSSLGYLTPAA